MQFTTTIPAEILFSKSKKILMKRGLTMQLNTIYKKDCIVGMRELPDASFDLLIADPPYNLSFGNDIHCDGQKSLQGMGGIWDKVKQDWDSFTLEEYLQFSLSWLSQAKRVLKDTGSMFIFGTYHNIGIINYACQLLGLEIINEIIWYKNNAFPNLAGRRLTASHETILWVHNSPKKRKYKFNYEFSKTGDFSYDSLKSQGKQMRTVWSIPNNKNKWELQFGKHPTQKPIRLIKRLISLTTDLHETILVPFCGSGSECVAAKILGRNFVSFEINDEYIELANKRLNDKDLMNYD